MRKPLRICQSSIKCMVKEEKTWIILGILFFFSLQYTEQVFLYSKEINYPVTQWIFPFAMYGSSFRLIIYASAIFLYSNIFNYERIHFYEIIRVGERNYLFGKIVFIFLIAILYTGAIQVLLILPRLNQIYLSGNWGKFWGMWALKQQEYAKNGLVVCSRYLYYMKAVEAMAYTAILFSLSCCIIGLIIYFFQLIGMKMLGIILSTIFLFMDFMVKGAYLEPAVIIKLTYISIFSWSDLSNLRLAGESAIIKGTPTVAYGVIGEMMIIVVLITTILVTWKISKKTEKTKEWFKIYDR